MFERLARKLIDKKKTPEDHLKIFKDADAPPSVKVKKRRDAWDAFVREQSGKAWLSKRLENVCGHYLEGCVKADLLANRYKWRFQVATMLIFLMAAAAVLVVSGQYIFHEFIPEWAIFIEIGLMIAVLLIIFVGNYYGVHRKWIDYRMLSERLRYGLLVDFLTDEPSGAEEEGFHIEWIKRSWFIEYYKELHKVNPQLGALPEGSLNQMKDFFRKFWIEEQIAHHKGKSGQYHRRHELISRASEFSYFLTIIVAFFHVFHIGHGFLGEHAGNIWTFLAIFFPVLGFTLSAMRGHYEFKKNSARSEALVESLEAYKESLAGIRDYKGFHELVKYAELVMLQENAGWHVSMGVHPPEIP